MHGYLIQVFVILTIARMIVTVAIIRVILSLLPIIFGVVNSN
jgi:hypothetical protein